MPEGPLVLVTGATGFIGRHLCPGLLAKGYRVRAAHRGPRPEGAGIEWIQVGEIGPDTDWTAALAGATHVVHLASLAHQVGVEGEAIRRRFQAVNVDGTRRLLEAVVQAGIPGRTVFVSSIGAVSGMTEVPVSEDTPCHPDSDYGRSKLEAEGLIREILGPAGRSWTILRPTLVYGPGNPGNMARLQRLVRLGLPLPLKGLRNRRSFVYVGNLVDGLLHCLEHPGAEGRAILLHDGRAVSTPELLRLVGQASGRPVRLFACPYPLLKGLARLGDLVHRLAGRSVGLDTYSLERLAGSLAVEASAAYARLQWNPPFTVEEGLRSTFEAESMGRRMP
ncbi:MAG TPA: NAD-dependent epimerase/dehydratase family protein [Holophagaceae bacterium]|nr:NAD-dependent epimerase/dehydratase family protein [Holophagaceae bacterium]